MNAPSQRQAPTPKRAAVRLLGCFAASSAHHSVPVASLAIACSSQCDHDCSCTQGTRRNKLFNTCSNTCRCTQDKKPKSKYLLLHSHCLIHCQFYSDPLSCLCLPSIRRLQTALDRLTIFPPGPPQLLSSSAAVTLATEQRRGCQLSLTLQAKTSWAR